MHKPSNASDTPRARLAIVTSHPIQYQAPMFRELAERCELTVFFAHRATSGDQAAAGFGVGFDWDVDLLTGYRHIFLSNVAVEPGLGHFSGCDTPEILGRLRDGAFDAVLICGWHLKAFVQALYAAKRLRLPVLARGDSQLQTPRAMWKKSIKAAAYPLFLRTFDAALYVGERSRTYWRHYGYPPHRMYFSPHCIDTGWFAARATPRARAALRGRLGIDEAAKVLLFAGKLVAFKRPLDVISAASRLRRDGIMAHVLVAGSGPLADEMRSAATASGVPLHLLGFCNQTEMPAAYAASDVLVLPSEGSETWGLVANEALACGTPIVVSDAAGCAPDLARDGAVGRTFPLGNVVALATEVAAALHAPPSADAMRRLSERFSLSSAAAGIISAAESTCGKRVHG